MRGALLCAALRALSAGLLPAVTAAAPAASRAVPFADAAEWALSLIPEVCFDKDDPAGCDHRGIADVWRYVLNNLHLAELSAEGREAVQDVSGFVAKLGDNPGMWYHFFTPRAAELRSLVRDVIRDGLVSRTRELRLPQRNGLKVPTRDGRSVQLASTPAATTTLRNGVEMPVLGFGVWQLAPDQCYESAGLQIRVLKFQS